MKAVVSRIRDDQAACLNCDWTAYANPLSRNPRYPTQAARRHVQQTGHDVGIERALVLRAVSR